MPFPDWPRWVRSRRLTPPAISGLAAYYSADVVTLTSSKVSTWPDQSGVGDAARDATQATAGNRPTVNATDAAYGNQPTLSFSSAFLVTGTWSAALAQAFTIIVVGEVPVDVGGHAFFDGIDLVSRALVWCPPGNAGVGVNLFAGSTLSSAAFAAGPHVFAFVFNGATSKIYIGNATTANASGAGGAQGVAGLSIGVLADAATGILGAGKIATLLAYAGALSQADLSRIMVWCGAKYALPVTP